MGVAFFKAAICLVPIQVVDAQGFSAEPARILAIEDESSQTRALGEALKARPVNEQVELLKEIFRLDTNGDATSAVVRLIRRSAADASTLDLAAQRLSGWSPGFQLNLLNNMYDYRTFYHLRGDAVDRRAGGARRLLFPLRRAAHPVEAPRSGGPFQGADGGVPEP